MKKLQNEKGAISITIIAILAMIVIGGGYGVYQAFKPKSTSLPVIPSGQPTAAPKILKVNFTETGNILNWDSQTESYLEDWILLYEKPGNPAISVNLVFNEASFCDLSEGRKVCDKSKLNNGDRAKIEGNKNNGEVTVINLTKF